MTRFWLTLEQGVEFVLAPLASACRAARSSCPRFPSMNIMDLARAIAPECGIEVVGIRPGEKLHEVLVSEDDARHTLEYGDHFVILPAFHEWGEDAFRLAAGRRPCAEGFRYGSDTNADWLTRGRAAPRGGDAKRRSPLPFDLAIEGGTPVRSKLLPYGRQWIDDDDIAAVVAILRSDWLTTGPAVGAFEQALARGTGAAHAVAVSSGTAALHAAMFALGVGPGDEVIVPRDDLRGERQLRALPGRHARLRGRGPVDAADRPRRGGEAHHAAHARPSWRWTTRGSRADYDALRALAERHGFAHRRGRGALAGRRRPRAAGGIDRRT